MATSLKKYIQKQAKKQTEYMQIAEQFLQDLRSGDATVLVKPNSSRKWFEVEQLFIGGNRYNPPTERRMKFTWERQTTSLTFRIVINNLLSGPLYIEVEFVNKTAPAKEEWLSTSPHPPLKIVLNEVYAYNFVYNKPHYATRVEVLHWTKVGGRHL